MSSSHPSPSTSSTPAPGNSQNGNGSTSLSLVSRLSLAAWGSGLISLVLWGVTWIGAGALLVGGMVWGAAQLAKRGLSTSQRPGTSEHPAQLKHELAQCRYLEHVEQYGEKAADQFNHLRERQAHIGELLNRKFRPGELTHGRYAAATEQTFLAMCDNLSEIASVLRAVNAIVPQEVEMRIREIGAIAAPQPNTAQELSALRERLALRKTQLENIVARLGGNEDTLTQMDRLSTALAALPDHSSHAALDLDSSLDELKRLADRVKRYHST